MVTKKIIVSIFALILAIIGGYSYFVQTAEAPIQDPQLDEPLPGGRVMDIKTYIRENISQLSPEPAVLGGTFYVTNVDASDGNGSVSYEDGHIALTADFTYIIDKYGITISSFEVREE